MLVSVYRLGLGWRACSQNCSALLCFCYAWGKEVEVCVRADITSHVCMYVRMYYIAVQGQIREERLSFEMQGIDLCMHCILGE